MVRGPTKKLFVSLSPSTVSGRSGAEYSNREYCPVSFVDIRRRGTSADMFTACVPGITPSVAGVISDGSWRHLRTISHGQADVTGLCHTHHASRARSDPSLIFHHISGLNIDISCVSAENAESKHCTETVVALKVFHNHCEYANPTEPTRLICVTKANVVPYLMKRARLAHRSSQEI